jgi:hypothetical protein
MDSRCRILLILNIVFIFRIPTMTKYFKTSPQRAIAFTLLTASLGLPLYANAENVGVDANLSASASTDAVAPIVQHTKHAKHLVVNKVSHITSATTETLTSANANTNVKLTAMHKATTTKHVHAKGSATAKVSANHEAATEVLSSSKQVATQTVVTGASQVGTVAGNVVGGLAGNVGSLASSSVGADASTNLDTQVSPSHLSIGTAASGSIKLP